ncbi:MAG: DUF2239 family protein [Brevundimonas sp.]|nr:DUF2239 family protein [Brevundimonas sp.]
MSAHAAHPVYAFAGDRLLGKGPLAEALPAVHAAAAAGEGVLVFDAASGKVIDLDLRGSAADAVSRLPAAPEPEKRGPGRPKLGVTPREVTLLPRHWDWLASQPGGASVALRKLVEGAMRSAEGPGIARTAKDAAYRLMTTLAGDRPGYEEATRMLFAGDWTAFDAAIESWPADVRTAVTEMAEPAWRNGAGR